MTKLITIVGAGALGSHVAMLLRNEGKIAIIDFDRVESKNTLSQFHGKPNVGKLKVSSLMSTMQFIWGVKIDCLPQRLAADNIKQLIHGDSDLVIDCVDNGATRRLIQQHVRDHGLPCLHGALAADGAFGRAIWDEDFKIDDEAGAGAATCEGGEHLPFIAITSAYVARMAQVFLKTGRKTGVSIYGYGAMPT